MIHAHDSFLKHLADGDARSIGAILAALPEVAALRKKPSYRVKQLSPCPPLSSPALRGNFA